jgi:hypothetical protein
MFVEITSRLLRAPELSYNQQTTSTVNDSEGFLAATLKYSSCHVLATWLPRALFDGCNILQSCLLADNQWHWVVRHNNAKAISCVH